MTLTEEQKNHAREMADAEKRIVEHDGFWIPLSEIARYSEMRRYEGIPDQDVDKLKKVIDLVPRHGCALDVGANIGTTASLLSKYFNQVHAFEPAFDLFAALKRNLAPYPHATAHQLAIGDKEGDVYLTQYVKHGQISHLSTGTAVENAKFVKVGPIRLRTIDSFGFDDVAFIKIDVEGFEGPVVRGAAETIKRCRPAIMVEQAGNEEKCFGLPANEASDFLESLGMVRRNDVWAKMRKDRLFSFPD